MCQRCRTKSGKSEKKGKIEINSRMCKIFMRVPQRVKSQETKQEHFSDLKDIIFYID